MLPRPRRSIARRLLRSRSGVAAIEFAMVLPLMLVLFFGMAEVTTLVTADRKLTLLSRSLADLTGRTSTMTDQGLADIFKASKTIIYPFDPDKVAMTIASVVVKNQNGSLRGTVCWSEGSGKDAKPPEEGKVVEVPDGFRTAGTSFIVATASTTHRPAVGYVISGDFALSEETPWPVRNVPEVGRTKGTATTPTRCL